VIFVVQTCPPRDPTEMVRGLKAQRDASSSPDALVVVVDDAHRDGQLPTMVRIFTGAARLGHDLTLVEDDVEVCADFVPFVLERWRDPGMPVVSWYAHPWLIPPGDPSARWVFPSEPFVGTQAVTFSLEFVKSFLASPLVAPFAKEHRHDGDQLAGLELKRRGWNFAVRVPGGAQHLGADSLVSTNPNPLRRVGQPIRFESKLYVGRNGRMGGAQ
jgi:hypothetical protein